MMMQTKTKKTEGWMQVNGYPEPGPWASIRRDLKSKRRSLVVAVVAYVGADGPAVMPLRRGDSLVCDASPSAIKSRRTSAHSLLEYDRKGVAVYSLEDLHAKVICAKTFAWVGSANASENSRDHLIEASIRVSGAQAQSVFEWALRQTVEDRALSTDDIRDLKLLPLDPAKLSAKRKSSVPPREVPRDLRKLVFYEVGPAGRREERIADKSRGSARTAARAAGLPSELSFLVWDGPTRAQAGDWIIQVSNGHVLKPAFVVRVARVGTERVLWLSLTRTYRKPVIQKMRDALPSLVPGFEEIEVSGLTKVSNLLRLFAIQ